jgi:peptide/nickel transport system permease protein
MKLKMFLAGLARLLALMLVTSLLGALLLRYAPGFASDERELNSGLSASSIRAIRQARQADANVARFYFHYLMSVGRGDLGNSLSLNQPVRVLLIDRLPLSLRNLFLALLLAWCLGLALALGAQATGSRLAAVAGEGLTGMLISTPAAALALVFVLLRLPPWIAGGLLVLPKIYRYSANLLREGYDQPHVLMARAKGVGWSAILFRHVVPIALPQWIALLGISVSIGIGVMLPLEAICDIPGIGQLAWQAALSRDLPLLVNLTMAVTLLSVLATTLSDSAKRSLVRSAA